jgi:hypothetical protein
MVEGHLVVQHVAILQQHRISPSGVTVYPLLGDGVEGEVPSLHIEETTSNVLSEGGELIASRILGSAYPSDGLTPDDVRGVETVHGGSHQSRSVGHFENLGLSRIGKTDQGGLARTGVAHRVVTSNTLVETLADPDGRLALHLFLSHRETGLSRGSGTRFGRVVDVGHERRAEEVSDESC